MKCRLKIENILDTTTAKNGTTYFKINFLPTWLPSDSLVHLSSLVEDFWKEKNSAPIETSTGPGINLNVQNSCCFCDENVHQEELSSHEQQHIDCISKEDEVFGNSAQSISLLIYEDQEIERQNDVKKAAATCNNISFRPDTKSPRNSNESSECAKLEEEKETGKNLDSSNAMEIQTENINSTAALDSNSIAMEQTETTETESTVRELACPKCSKGFKTFSEFRLHFHSHQVSNSYYECEQCLRKFYSKELFEKHNALHAASNRRQKSYGKKIMSTKKLTLRRALMLKMASSQMQPDQTPCSDELDLLFPYEERRQFMDGKLPKDIKESKDVKESKDLKQPKDVKLTKDVKILKDQVKHKLTAREFLGVRDLHKNTRRLTQYEEFSPEVLKAAREYIKSVSIRRKQSTQQRLQQSSKTDSMNDRIGVDVELQKNPDAMPIITIVGGKQSYGCKSCGKTFFNKFHHREHYTVHSGEMPYLCEFCMKRFAQRSGWNRHIKLHHKYKVFNGPLPRGAEKSFYSRLDSGPPLTEAMAIIQSDHHTESQVLLTQNIRTATMLPSDHQGIAFFVPRTNCGTSPSATYLPVSPIKGTQAVDGDTASLPAPSESDNRTNAPGTKPKQTIFQCKKVRAMDDKLIFMVRVAAPNVNATFNEKEFAYVLDDSGHVTSRIFVNDYPGGDWLDFPLDELANDVLLVRIHSYNEMNKRGPKPSFYITAVDKEKPYTIHYLPDEETEIDMTDIDISSCSPNNLNITMQQTNEIDEGTAKDLLKDAEKLIPITQEKLAKTKTGAKLRSISGRDTQKINQGRVFRSGKEKRFQCNVCQRKFLAQAHLNDHFLIHTGELPFKCMFCARPFRHKSGLNSHHKRHIQKGVFNRPISGYGVGTRPSMKTYSQKIAALKTADVITPRVDSANENVSTKGKRKGRKPKQVLAIEPDTEVFDEVQIKLEEDEMVEPASNVVEPASSVSFQASIEEIDVTEDMNNLLFDENVFECNFCSLKFPIRTAYLKHVHATHKGKNISTNTDILNVSLPSNNIDSIRTSVSSAKDKLYKGHANEDYEKMDFENLFPGVKIKQEIIEEF